MARQIVWPCPLCGEKINYAVVGVDIERTGLRGPGLGGTLEVESEHRC